MRVNPTNHYPLQYTHKIYQCGAEKGEWCVLHNPTPYHKLAGAPLDWSIHDRTMSRVCVHNELHPDPDDADFRVRTRMAKNLKEAEKHKCDGCCGRTVTARTVKPIKWKFHTKFMKEEEVKEFVELLSLRNDEWMWDKLTHEFDIRVD